jgi:hypothetical protein
MFRLLWSHHQAKSVRNIYSTLNVIIWTSIQYCCVLLQFLFLLFCTAFLILWSTDHMWSSDHMWSLASALVVLLDWTLFNKDRKNIINVNCVSHTIVENLKQFAFKGDKSRVVRGTFWLTKVVPTWKKFGKRWYSCVRTQRLNCVDENIVFAPCF